MSNPTPANRSESLRPLAETLADVGQGITSYKQYLGRRAAREAMEEFGVIGRLDETTEAALEDTFGTMVNAGMTLNMRGTTEPEDTEAEEARLLSQIPPSIQDAFHAIVPYMIQLGIDFHRDEVAPNTPKVQAWAEEFVLLQPLDRD